MKQIGRILSSTVKTARIEVDDRANIEEGMLVQIQFDKRTVVGKLERIETKRTLGVLGYIYWLDILNKPPRTFLPVYEASDETEVGVIHVGEDKRGIPVGLKLNPMFGHTLVAGMTTAGKTHFLLVLSEELGKLKVPSLIFDPQGEFVNLAAFDNERYVTVQELRIEELKAYMNQRKTVIYNLLGFSKSAKVSRVAELVAEIMEMKEKDYQQAEGEMKLLQWPPMLLMLDEADLFCPHKTLRVSDRVAAIPIIDILERGAKFGLGCVVATQRITRLDIDVRSQCNSTAVFRIIDGGSMRVVKGIDYIPHALLEDIKGFEQGECILAGSLVTRPRKVQIRDIETKRAKKRDFEEMLGIHKLQAKVEENRSILQNARGDIITKDGTMVYSVTDRLREEDKKLFEEADNDGVVLRGPMTPDDERMLKELLNETEKNQSKPKVTEVPKSWKKNQSTR